MKIKLMSYILCSAAIIFIIVLLNKLSVSESETIGLGDLILRNVGLIYIFNSLGKHFRTK